MDTWLKWQMDSYISALGIENSNNSEDKALKKAIMKCFTEGLIEIPPKPDFLKSFEDIMIDIKKEIHHNYLNELKAYFQSENKKEEKAILDSLAKHINDSIHQFSHKAFNPYHDDVLNTILPEFRKTDVEIEKQALLLHEKRIHKIQNKLNNPQKSQEEKNHIKLK